MKKVNKKKGFTLAELLVVLAILAVLVAIAVPLFTGAIGDANKTVIDANIRSIKSAALLQIAKDSSLADDADGKWYATCTITNGEMGDITVSETGTPSRPSEPNGTYVVEVTQVDITTG